MTRSFRIGVDCGGTFTDLVVADESSRLIAEVKSPSVPAAPTNAVISAVIEAAEQLGVAVDTLLGHCGLFIHGTTIATNTVLEGTGARVGLICTTGFRDVLAIRRGRRGQLWNLREPRIPAIVPRHLRLGIDERTDRGGRVELAPRPEELAAISDVLEKHQVEAIAVCLFNSHANPANEEAVGDYLRRRFPDLHISVSNRILPLIGEYERTSTTVLDAYVAPRTAAYLTFLRDRLVSLGLKSGRLLVAQSNGGLLAVEACIAQPGLILLSGPSAAAAAARLFGRAAGSRNVVVFDMGGTSCDVTLLADGRAAHREVTRIGGYESGLPSVDVHTIGTGGGTIATVPNGLLRVGPESAGAEPGPACYDKGGKLPTVTDANVVLGRLDPSRFFGGRMRLDGRLAEEAVAEVVAKPLHVDAAGAAAGIVTVADQNMIEAIRLMTVERGHDPREFVLLAAGGAAGLHVGAIVRQLGMKRAYIPRQAPVFCAVGLLQSDIRRVFFRAVVSPLHLLTVSVLEAAIRRLQGDATQELDRAGLSATAGSQRLFAGLRYSGHQALVPVEVTHPIGGDAIGRLKRGFDREHEYLYGFSRPDSDVEISHLQLVVSISTGGLRLPTTGSKGRYTPNPTSFHRICVDGSEPNANVPLFSGLSLNPGARILGAALVDSENMSILVLGGQSLEVDAFRNYVLSERRGDEDLSEKTQAEAGLRQMADVEANA